VGDLYGKLRDVDDLDEELRDIKREIIESRGLVIKTNNLTNALAADLKTIGRRQQTFERRASWNSAAANLLFVVVILGVVKVSWDFRADSVERELTRSQTEANRLREDLNGVQRIKEERARAESAAATFYELIRTGKRKEILEGYDAVAKEQLTRAERAFFGDEIKRARGQLSMTAYHTGIEQVRSGKWQEAVASLEDSLRNDDAGTHAPAARLALGQAYRKLNRQRDAIPLLVKLSEASANPDVQDDAAFLLSECLVDIQAWNDAKTALRTFLRRFPQSSFANDARMTLADLEAKH